MTNILLLSLAIILSTGGPMFGRDLIFRSDSNAPELDGGVEWMNTAKPVRLADLKGKVVLLDFWTYCCINCMHIMPTLAKMEKEFPNELVIIGVHSGKFDAEKDSANIRNALLRYDVEHPVVNDRDFIIWRKYDINAWPSLVLIGADGNIVERLSGEPREESLRKLIRRYVDEAKAKGILNTQPIRFRLEKEKLGITSLKYPGKIRVDEKGKRIFITDSNHQQIVITDLNGKKLETIGSGKQGAEDGAFEKASFFRPQGVVLVGDLLYLADTENHLVRAANLKTRRVDTVIGTGKQGTFEPDSSFKARKSAISSPWDLLERNGQLYIAMAGTHQIWRWDIAKDRLVVFAGTGRENIFDGERLAASLAQPSGLSADEKFLYFADSEVSAVRKVPLEGDGEVQTIIGKGLFEFGDADGTLNVARLQHPLQVLFHQGRLFIADTYNHKIREIVLGNPTKIVTIAGEKGVFNEPGGLSALGDTLYVADTNNHSIKTIDLKTREVRTLIKPTH